MERIQSYLCLIKQSNPDFDPQRDYGRVINGVLEILIPLPSYVRRTGVTVISGEGLGVFEYKQERLAPGLL